MIQKRIYYFHAMIWVTQLEHARLTKSLPVENLTRFCIKVRPQEVDSRILDYDFYDNNSIIIIVMIDWWWWWLLFLLFLLFLFLFLLFLLLFLLFLFYCCCYCYYYCYHYHYHYLPSLFIIIIIIILITSCFIPYWESTGRVVCPIPVLQQPH